MALFGWRQGVTEQVSDDTQLVTVFYRDYYHRVFDQRGIAGWMYRKTHELVEKGVDNTNKRILEIGAGGGEHLEYVRGDFCEYVMLDPQPGDPKHGTIGQMIVGKAETANFSPSSFDRIISMCVLHHVDDVPQVLRNIKVWLAPGGTFSLFLPSDPGILNRINRKILVSPRSTRLGFSSYKIVNAREHKNHYWSIKTELDHQFAGFDVSRKYFPLPLRAGNLSLFSIWHFTKPILA